MNLLLVTLVLLGLFLGKELLVPFVLALVLWYLINSLRRQVGRIRFGKKQLPNWAQTLISILFIFAIFRFIGKLVISNLKEFNEVAPEYNARINEILLDLSEYFNVTSIEEISQKFDLPGIVGELLNSSVALLLAIFVVLFYLIFLLLEQGVFSKKLDLIFTEQRKKVQFYRIIEKVDLSISTYLSVKAMISLMVAVSSYIILVSFGIDFAVLWAVFAFLLNFIPFVGAFVAIVFPTIISILQFADPVITIVLFSILLTVQLVMGNFVEPKLVGKSLNLSPLVVVLSLAFWGSIWGVAGMFLCIPITVALMIVLNQVPSTKWIAIVLSAGNDLDAK